MKQFLKGIVVGLLGRQVKQLRKKHDIKVVGVVGGIGKTSTKMAVAQVLGKTLRVRYQAGNYNDVVSVPLIFFDQPIPSLFNPFSWAKVLLDNSKQIRGKYPFDVVVVEIGTDMPGQIEAFSKYLHLDIAIVTAIVPEHMENFADIKAVAEEELAVTKFADKIIYNADLVDTNVTEPMPDGSLSYGLDNKNASYYLTNIFHSAGGYEGDVKHNEEIYLHFSHEVVSKTQLYSVMAAIIVGDLLALKHVQILAGIASITPVSGRLRRLRGINGSLIIDDTYNASPEAVKAGLRTLYELDFPNKIAVLGNMNELGKISEAAHKEIGEMCDPKQLSLVLTLGPDANKYIASSAELKGCKVVKFETPYQLGEYLQSKIEPETVIFAKGSQNKVFAEEAVKMILADPEDANKLVRQSDYWLKRKKINFGIK